jgi:hypothetical protein
MTTSLSSLEPQIGSSTNNNYASSSSQMKSHKKKRQMSPRSKSKLDSLVTQPSLQQQQQQQQDRVHDKSQRTYCEGEPRFGEATNMARDEQTRWRRTCNCRS